MRIRTTRNAPPDTRPTLYATVEQRGEKWLLTGQWRCRGGGFSRAKNITPSLHPTYEAAVEAANREVRPNL